MRNERVGLPKKGQRSDKPLFENLQHKMSANAHEEFQLIISTRTGNDRFGLMK